MSFALLLIGNFPQVQDKIFEELRKNIEVNDGALFITFDDLKKMVYLEATIKECLRLLPSVPIIGRKLSSDIE